jgi:hypothetical protein
MKLNEILDLYCIQHGDEGKCGEIFHLLYGDQ